MLVVGVGGGGVGGGLVWGVVWLGGVVFVWGAVHWNNRRRSFKGGGLGENFYNWGHKASKVTRTLGASIRMGIDGSSQAEAKDVKGAREEENQ